MRPHLFRFIKNLYFLIKLIFLTFFKIMTTEIINILSHNIIQKFDLIENLEGFIKLKLKDYVKELQQNNFKILPWRRLELITAYKNDALLYEDVPEYIKEKHNLPSRDEGIDVIKVVEGKIVKVFQCKCYTTKLVCKNDLNSFYQYQQLKYNLNDADFMVVGSLQQKSTKIYAKLNMTLMNIMAKWRN